MSGRSNDVQRIIREFADGKLTADQLANELRTCAERPDGLRAFRSMRIDLQQVPEERLFTLVQTVSTITHPILARFFDGDVSAEEAATQVAPYFLMWGGFGIDPPAGADTKWHTRRAHLMQKIAEAASRD